MIHVFLFLFYWKPLIPVQLFFTIIPHIPLVFEMNFAYTRSVERQISDFLNHNLFEEIVNLKIRNNSSFIDR